MAATQHVALVTGGSRGIGAATVTGLAAAGWDVVFTYRSDEAAATRVRAAGEQLGRRVLALRADLVEPAAVEQTYARVDESFGRLDALVNNAGIAAPQSTVEQYQTARVAQLMAVNVVAPIMLAARAIPRLRAAGGGSIVNVSSIAARLGSSGEYVDYAASKAAVDTLTIGLSREVAVDKIRVTSVRPGVISTDIHATNGQPGRAARVGAGAPWGRPGEPEEVARTIVWLVTAAPDYLTGSVIDVGGGR